MTTAEYRIEFRITRRRGTEDDFAEVGFGSTGACESVNDAAYEVESMIQNQIWETESGQPNPEELETSR